MDAESFEKMKSLTLIKVFICKYFLNVCLLFNILHLMKSVEHYSLYISCDQLKDIFAQPLFFIFPPLMVQVLLINFASKVGAKVTKVWTSDVTHVIAATDENGACSRTLKVLMAILNGRWILKMDCKLLRFFVFLCLLLDLILFNFLLSTNFDESMASLCASYFQVFF